jgi:adenine/guanine phosphoribosyltransferase-like PRPP-binding protein
VGGQIHPIKIEGNWEIGYALDLHTTSSQFLGYDDFGNKQFDNKYSQIGELLFRLKYRSDKSAIPEIVRLVMSFASFKTIDVIIPVPPSHANRDFQPVIEIALAIGTKFGVPVLTNAVKKIKDTPELKNIETFEERQKVLHDAFTVEPVGVLYDSTVLLFDDLYRSGATLSSLTTVLYNQGKAKSVRVLTLTKTRSKIMTKVFIGGSRRIGRLNNEIRQRLDNIIAHSFTVLVGDASGVDKSVQKHFADKHYGNVIVFCAGRSCRNNVGGWETKHLQVDGSTKDYRFYMAKDIEMAKEADYGFMIWDAQSGGTLSNILELLEMGKKVLVYMGPNKDFVKLQRVEDLRKILQACPDQAVKIFDTKFNLSRRLQTEAPQQFQMFP